MRHLAAWLTLVGTALIIAACSSGNSGSPGVPPTRAPTATIGGAVVDGPVSGATVNAYEVTAAGAAGTLIGGPVTTSTDGKGTYTLNLNLQTLDSYSGPILLQATSGTYIDDVTGQSVDLAKAGLTLSALIPPPAAGWSAAGTVEITVNPLSTIAANIGLGQIADGTSADSAATAASRANAAVATYFGGLSNLLTTTVLDLSQAGCSTSAAQASIDESVVIAAISQLAASAGVSTPNLEAALISDVVADGTFDGTANGTPILVALNAGGSIDLTAIIGTKGLAAALQTAAAAFTASNADVCKAPESSGLISSLSSSPSPLMVPPPIIFTLNGSTSGLPAGSSVQVKFNLLLTGTPNTAGTDNFQYFLTTNGNFSETQRTAYASSDITGWTQSMNSSPAGYKCVLSPLTGSFSTTISNITLACTALNFTVGGSVTGLTASGLQLMLNGGSPLTVAANAPNAATFVFPALPTGTSYTVSVATQPTGETCTVNPPTASGTIDGANVTNVAVSCSGGGGTTPIALDGPNGLAFDGGNLYLANYLGGQVIVYSVQYNSTHGVTGLTQVGSITAGLNNPSRIAVDSSGNLYVANHGGNNVTIYSAAGGGLIDTIADPSLNGPLGVAVDAKGDVYVANNTNDSVSVFTPNSPNGPGSGYTLASTVTQDGSGNAFLAPGVLFDANIGAMTAGLVQGEFLLLGLGPQGSADHVTVYGSSSSNETYPLLTGSSQPFFDLSGVNGCGMPSGPTGIALYLDAAAPLSSAIYVTSYYNNEVFEYPATDFVVHGGASCPTPVINGNGINAPEGIAVDAYGNLFVANSANSSPNANSIVVYAGNVAFANAQPILVYTTP